MSAPETHAPIEQVPCLGRSRPTRITPQSDGRARVDEAGLLVHVAAPSRRSYSPLLPYVRRRRWTYEARCPLGGLVETVTLGQYPSREQAGDVADEFYGRGGFLSPLDYVRVLAEMVARGVVRPGVLPKWVYPTAGDGYAARRGGRLAADAPGPFAEPGLAFLALLAVIEAAARDPEAAGGRHWRESRVIAGRYGAGDSAERLAADYGVTDRTIRRVLAAVGVRRRPVK